MDESYVGVPSSLSVYFSLPDLTIWLIIIGCLVVLWFGIYYVYRYRFVASLVVFGISWVLWFIGLLPFQHPPIPIVSLVIAVGSLGYELIWPLIFAKNKRKSVSTDDFNA